MLFKSLARSQASRQIITRNFAGVRSFQTNIAQRGGGHHDEHHDSHHDEHHHEEPYTDNDGRLFGIAQGEQYKSQGWEKRFLPLMYGGVLLLVIGLAFKPDYSVQSWAKEEALRRRAARASQQE